MTAQFEARNEYEVKAKVIRTPQRKFKVQIVGEAPRQVSKAKAISLATQAALALNMNPEPTESDVEAAEALTAKMPRGGVPSDHAEIRSGVSVSGRRVSLHRFAFGRFVVRVAGVGQSKAMGRKSGLLSFAAALRK
jgi:hypothetical protein